MSTNTNDKYTEYHMTTGVYRSNGWVSTDRVATRSTGTPWTMIFIAVFVLFVIGILVVNAI